jgi:tryptophan 2-monooxygenase
MFRIARQRGLGRAPEVSPTVNNLKTLPIYYPDQPTVSWESVALGKMITPSTLAGDLDVCVVGRGASALGVMTELNEIAKSNSGAVISVSNIYYDTEAELAGDTAATYASKFGRIFSAKPGVNFQEIGCMRFPSIALLTWNYISQAYPTQGDAPLTRFPNPGRVPTQFLFRDMNVVFEIDETGETVAISGMNDADQIQNLATMEVVKNGVIDYMLDSVTDSVNGRTVGYFATILVGNTGENPTILEMSEEQVEKVWSDWNTYISEYDVPLIDIVQEAIASLVADGSIALSITRDESYYVELFGRYGFGTGGFRPLNNVTFNEIARLLIWNYSDEYLFPGNTGDSSSPNTDFASKLLAGIDTVNLSSNVEKALFIGRRLTDSKLVVVSYSKSQGRIVESVHDYVVLATSHHAAQRVLEPFSGMLGSEVLPRGSKLNFEIDGSLLPYTTTTDFLHPFDQQNGGSGNLYAALKNLHMMRTTKYFTDVTTSEFNSYAPSNTLETKRVKMVISDTDLAATYCLDGQDGTTNVLVSYTWGDEASNEASALNGLTSYAGSTQDAVLRKRHAQTTNRFAQTSNGSAITGFWVSNMLANADQISGYMYDWSSDQDSRGAFKLDWASETPFSTGLYDHFRTSVLNVESGTQAQKQRLFVAGDSFSHYGGWLEGAFMTGITSVAGVMRSEYGSSVFSDAGNKLFLTEGGTS